MADLKRANLRRKWSTIPKAAPTFHNQPSCFAAWRLFVLPRSPVFELAYVLVRFNHVANFIVHADRDIMGSG